MLYVSQILFVRKYQGRGDEVIEIFRQSASAYGELRGTRAGLASTLCWLDLHDEARTILEQAATASSTSGRRK
jgi:hypothetical protein